jgi:hypothetical protein
MPNSCPPSNPSATPPPSPARQHFLQRLDALSIKPTTHEYYVRWAEAWNKALGHRSAERTHAFFDALGRTARLADWQFLGGRRRPAGCVRHPAEHSSAKAQPKAHPRPRDSNDPMGRHLRLAGPCRPGPFASAALLIHHGRQKPRRCLDPHNLTLPDHHLGRGATA